MQATVAVPPGESGQGATELMLVISVVVLGIVATAYTFAPRFANGVDGLSARIQKALEEHNLAGRGLDAGLPKTAGAEEAVSPAVPPVDVIGFGVDEHAPMGPRDAWYRETLESEHKALLRGRAMDIIHSPKHFLPDNIS